MKVLQYSALAATAVAPPGHGNRVRIALWGIQWAAMAYWFYRMALQARADR